MQRNEKLAIVEGTVRVPFWYIKLNKNGMRQMYNTKKIKEENGALVP